MTQTVHWMSTRTLLSAAAAGAATATVGFLVYFGLFRSHELLVATIDEITRLKAELKAAKKELRKSNTQYSTLMSCLAFEFIKNLFY